MNPIRADVYETGHYLLHFTSVDPAEPGLAPVFVQMDMENRGKMCIRDRGEKSTSKVGNTVLDRIHQSLILFAAGRGEALKRFLVDEGVGQDQRFWRLAQSLSALYPKGTDERRWVEGVLARKKGCLLYTSRCV